MPRTDVRFRAGTGAQRRLTCAWAGLGSGAPCPNTSPSTFRGTTEGGTASATVARRDHAVRDQARRVMLALYTGLRRDDVRTMRFDQVDFDDRPCTYRTRRAAPARRSRSRYRTRRSRSCAAVRTTTPRTSAATTRAGASRESTSRVRSARSPSCARPARTTSASPSRTCTRCAARGSRSRTRPFPSWTSTCCPTTRSARTTSTRRTSASTSITPAKCADKIDAGITRRIKGTTPTRKKKQRHLHAVA